MSFLSTALRRIMQANKLLMIDLSRSTGIVQPQISRICSGKIANVSDETFHLILSAVTRDPIERAELVAARCLDVKSGPGSELVEIVIRKPGRAIKKHNPRWVDMSGLPEETARAIEFLVSEIPHNSSAEKMVVGHAEILGMPRGGESRSEPPSARPGKSYRK